MIENFTLFGERHSGTNVIRAAFQNNLRIPFIDDFGYKHWFIKGFEPRPPENTTTDLFVQKDVYKDGGNTLFIFTVRHPFTWIPAMFKKPHHMYNIKKNNLYSFVTSPAMSFEKNGARAGWIPNEDGILFIEKHNNIIELRNEKNTHFYNLKNEMNYFGLVRYEYFNEDIRKIINKFNLKVKGYGFVPIPPSYKNYPIDGKVKNFITENLNNEIDEKYYNFKRKRA